jgi:hypothetical protein
MLGSLWSRVVPDRNREEKMVKLASLGLMILSCSWGAGDRSDLNGTWLISEGKLTRTLSISQKGDGVELTDSATEANGKQKKVDVACQSDGQPCKVKMDGHPAEVSFWFNGQTLVMLEQTHGNDFVTKWRMKASDDGKTLTMEIEHVSPPGRKTENITFTRQP